MHARNARFADKCTKITARTARDRKPFAQMRYRPVLLSLRQAVLHRSNQGPHTHTYDARLYLLLSLILAGQRRETDNRASTRSWRPRFTVITRFSKLLLSSYRRYIIGIPRNLMVSSVYTDLKRHHNPTF
jgi:hypothetical protein